MIVDLARCIRRWRRPGGHSSSVWIVCRISRCRGCNWSSRVGFSGDRRHRWCGRVCRSLCGRGCQSRRKGRCRRQRRGATGCDVGGGDCGRNLGNQRRAGSRLRWFNCHGKRRLARLRRLAGGKQKHSWEQKAHQHYGLLFVLVVHKGRRRYRAWRTVTRELRRAPRQFAQHIVVHLTSVKTLE